MILKDRAEDIVSLVDKTINEFKNLENFASGDIYVGAAESDSVKYFAETIKTYKIDFQKSDIMFIVVTGKMFAKSLIKVCLILQ